MMFIAMPVSAKRLKKHAPVINTVNSQGHIVLYPLNVINFVNKLNPGTYKKRVDRNDKNLRLPPFLGPNV